MTVKTMNNSDRRVGVMHSVRNMYNQSAPLLLAEAILFAVIAGFAFYKPMSVLTTMTMVIGCVLICFGLYRTIGGYIASNTRGGGYFDLGFGLINVVLGILFCVHPSESAIGVIYIFLVLFLVKSLLMLIFAINMARARFGHYLVDIAAALFMVAIAVLLMLYPLRGAIAMTILMGVLLVIYAVADVYMFIQLRRLYRRIAE